MEKPIKVTPFRDLKDKYVGKPGTPERNTYEAELKSEVNAEKTGYGLSIIQTERIRQVDHHRWTAENDDQYSKRELLLYARYWMTAPQEEKRREDIKRELRLFQQSGWGDEWFTYDQKTSEERLARAGALIAAEIDRQRRASK